MSLALRLEKLIDDFAQKIATQFNLDKNEVLKVWTGTESQPVERKKSNILVSVDLSDLGESRLLSSTAVELKALCKSKNLKCSGTKDQLIERLRACRSGNVEEPRRKSPEKKKTEEKKVLTKLVETTSAITLRENAHGNFEHPPTKLVFSRKPVLVIGKQSEQGVVLPLTDDDIQICKKYKFPYQIPDNLDQNNEVEVDMQDEDDIPLAVEDDEEEVEEIEDEDEDVEID